MLRSLLLFLLLALALATQAQVSPGLQLAREVWNSRSTNPAIVQPYTLVVALPGVMNDLNVNGLTYGDVLQAEGSGAVIDADRLLDRLGARFDVRERVEVPTLGLSFFLGKMNVSVSHGTVFDAQLDVPRELPELLWRGNAPFIGQTLRVDPKVLLNAYHRVQLSTATQITDNLTIGASLNLLSGISALETERFDVDFTTDDDIYALTLDTDLRVHSAGSLDYNGLDDIRIESPTARLTFSEFLTNPSATIDLGARYQTEKLDLAASVLNLTAAALGYDETQGVTYTGNRSFTYTGIDGNAAIVDGEAIDFNTALDTLTTLLDLERRAGAFEAPLPQQLYLSGLYRLHNDWELGAAAAIDRYRSTTKASGSVLARYRVLEDLHVGASYGFHRDNFTQIGLQAYGKLGPVQLYALTENVGGLLNLENANRVHFRAGVNLLFGAREPGQ